MGRLETRLSRLEAQTAALPCPHPWHMPPDPITPRRIDYRESAKVLAPDAPPPAPLPPDTCPECAEERPQIEVRAFDYRAASLWLAPPGADRSGIPDDPWIGNAPGAEKDEQR